MRTLGPTTSLIFITVGRGIGRRALTPRYDKASKVGRMIKMTLVDKSVMNKPIQN